MTLGKFDHLTGSDLVEAISKENELLIEKVSKLETRLIQIDMKHPYLAVDVVVLVPQGIVLIERKWEPKGWALPGGHVDYNESCETAAVREMKEEISLDVTLVGQVGTYSEPSRDPRKHCVSVAFLGFANGIPVAADDAKAIMIVPNIQNLPTDLCFDHRKIIIDALAYASTKGISL